ncbi:hypothetical protein H5410_058865 [Solanum commersonii]|uniref:Uncharacterized protein n=1 Tax=Solanum commersonii TaxID=4109 RepID=A0A9J5W0S8_SOLCO|nr:hypothetical protein H5410_058865 [Solanum commersonii]
MKHVTTGTRGTGLIRTHLRKCNKEFARLDDIEGLTEMEYPYPKNSMGVGGSNMVQNFVKLIMILFILSVPHYVYNLIVKDGISQFGISCEKLDLLFQKKYALDGILLFEMLQVAYIYRVLYN